MQVNQPWPTIRDIKCVDAKTRHYTSTPMCTHKGAPHSASTETVFGKQKPKRDRLGGTRQDKHTLGCPSGDKLARAHSIVVSTKQEQQIGDWKRLWLERLSM
jgi:hypothetical protein